MNGLLSIDQPARAARPDLMPAGRIVHAYFSEAKYEFLRLLRTPAFAVPILVLPIVVYLLFGVVMANDAITKNPAVGVYLFCGFSVFAVIAPGLLGVGISLALERDSGLLKLKRVLPAPPGAYILAKMLMAMVFATFTTASMIVMGVLIAKVALSAGQLAALAGVMVLGTLPLVCAPMKRPIAHIGSVPRIITPASAASCPADSATFAMSTPIRIIDAVVSVANTIAISIFARM